MQDIVIGLALKWLTSEMASSAAAMNWTALKAKVQTAVGASVHSAWLSTELISIADTVIDATAKMAQDQPDLLAALKALAAKNMPGAEAALKALLQPVLNADLAALLAS